MNEFLIILNKKFYLKKFLLKFFFEILNLNILVIWKMNYKTIIKLQMNLLKN